MRSSGFAKVHHSRVQTSPEHSANIIIEITYDFLSNADLVKFAKFKPMASINEEMMKQATEIVEKTKPAPEKEITAEVSNV